MRAPRLRKTWIIRGLLILIVLWVVWLGLNLIIRWAMQQDTSPSSGSELLMPYYWLSVLPSAASIRIILFVGVGAVIVWSVINQKRLSESPPPSKLGLIVGILVFLGLGFAASLLLPQHLDSTRLNGRVYHLAKVQLTPGYWDYAVYACEDRYGWNCHQISTRACGNHGGYLSVDDLELGHDAVTRDVLVMSGEHVVCRLDVE